jgi:hypothetical protein
MSGVAPSALFAHFEIDNTAGAYSGLSLRHAETLWF